MQFSSEVKEQTLVSLTFKEIGALFNFICIYLGLQHSLKPGVQLHQFMLMSDNSKPYQGSSDKTDQSDKFLYILQFTRG